MGYDCGEHIRSIVRPNCNESGIELALDLVRKKDSNPYVERAIRHIYLESCSSDRVHVFLIDVNERQIVTVARESTTDDSADGSGTDDDHTRAHVDLLECFR